MELRNTGKLIEIKNEWKVYETSPRRVGAGYESCFSQNLSRLSGRGNDCNGEFPRIKFGAGYVAKKSIRVYEKEDLQNNDADHNFNFYLIVAYALIMLVFTWVFLIIVHDLRSPFNSIIGFSTILTRFARFAP